MKYTHLLTLLLLSFNGYGTTSDTGASFLAMPATEQYSLILPAFPAPRAGGGSPSVHLSTNAQMGYMSLTKTAKGVSKSASSVYMAGDFGLRIFIPSTRGNNVGIINVGLGVDKFWAEFHDSVDARYFNVFKVPLSYTSVRYGNRNNFGYFWQLGVNVGKLTKVTNKDNKKVTQYFNSMVIEPELYGGIVLGFITVERWTERTLAHGMFTAGPFITYIATNLTAETNASMRGYAIGIKACLIYF